MVQNKYSSYKLEMALGVCCRVLALSAAMTIFLIFPLNALGQSGFAPSFDAAQAQVDQKVKAPVPPPPPSPQVVQLRQELAIWRGELAKMQLKLGMKSKVIYEHRDFRPVPGDRKPTVQRSCPSTR